MILFPAIDIRGGKCVRLTEGRFDQETIFADDPAEMADKWSEAGAEFLHVVDLDGALAGSGQNLETIRRIVQHAKMPVEVGGGIRDVKAVSTLLEMGVARVILGSIAVKNPAALKEICKYFPSQAVVGIDAKNGEVAVEGWGQGSGMDYIELGKQMAAMGIEHIIFTDISRDGKLSGVNVEATARLAKETGVKIIASGGVAGLQDIKDLMAYEDKGIEGVIIGKAIYTGAVDLKEALALTKSK